MTRRPPSSTTHDAASAGRIASDGSTAVSVSYSWLTNDALPRSPWWAGSMDAGAPARIVTVVVSAADAGVGATGLPRSGQDVASERARDEDGQDRRRRPGACERRRRLGRGVDQLRFHHASAGSPGSGRRGSSRRSTGIGMRARADHA